jgi:uncharacterized protein
MATAIPATKHRFEILDIVRGIALLGVLLANTKGFAGFWSASDVEKSAMLFAPSEPYLLFITSAFLDGKFYSLFSLLFGVSFALIISKDGGNRIIFRRLAILLLIGLAHALLLWDGDILVLYAVLGFSLPLFNRLKNKSLLIIAIFLIFSPVLLDQVRLMNEGGINPEGSIREMGFSAFASQINGEPSEEVFITKMKSPGVINQLEINQVLFFFRWGYLLESNRLPKVLGLFLLGLLIGRNKLYANLPARLPELQKFRNFALAIGLPASLLQGYLLTFTDDVPLMTKTLLYFLGTIPMSLAYLAIICSLYARGKCSSVFNVFAPFGRMALTCYVMQSVIGIIIYRGIGLGLMGQFGPAIYLFIGIVTFALQLLFCHWWLKHFAFGPLEWMWRQMTYCRRIPLRIKSNR